MRHPLDNPAIPEPTTTLVVVTWRHTYGDTDEPPSRWRKVGQLSGGECYSLTRVVYDPWQKQYGVQYEDDDRIDWFGTRATIEGQLCIEVQEPTP